MSRLDRWIRSRPISGPLRSTLRAVCTGGPGFLGGSELLAMLSPPKIPADDPRAVRVEVLETAPWTGGAYAVEPSDPSNVVGPPCHCGHTRTVHAGPGFWDGPCRVEGCDCTAAGYQPARAWEPSRG